MSALPGQPFRRKRKERRRDAAAAGNNWGDRIFTKLSLKFNMSWTETRRRLTTRLGFHGTGTFAANFTELIQGVQLSLAFAVIIIALSSRAAIERDAERANGNPNAAA